MTVVGDVGSRPRRLYAVPLEPEYRLQWAHVTRASPGRIRDVNKDEYHVREGQVIEVMQAVWAVPASSTARRAVLGVLLLAMMNWAGAESAGAARPPWYPLKWVIGSLDGRTQEHVAVLVEATIDGRSCDLQLDTGLNSAIRWHTDEDKSSAGEKVKIVIAGAAREVNASKETLRVLNADGPCSASGPIGSVGNAFFEQGTLTLDLRKDRFSYDARPRLFKSVRAQPFFYPRWGSDGGHILVEIRATGQPGGYAMFDTGAASASLNVLDVSSWSLLTGDAALGKTPRVRTFEVSSWGRRHRCFEMTSKHELTVTGYRLKAPLVSYCPELGFDAPIRLAGILGLRSFRGRIVTLDYPSRRWLISTQ